MSTRKDFTKWRKYQRSVSLVQRSPEWHASRVACVGGSELAAWMGVNPYRRKPAFIAEKINGSRFFSNPAMTHGTLCEGVAARYTEKYFGCLLQETGSVDGCVPYHRYSPDGLALLPKNLTFNTQRCPAYTIGDKTANTTNTTQPIDDPEYDLVLFEFKNPFKNEELYAEIPPHYIPQPLSGLCDIPLANYALFINCKVQVLDYPPTQCGNCGNIDYCGSAPGSKISTKVGRKTIVSYGDTCVKNAIAAGYIGFYTLAPMAVPDSHRKLMELPGIYRKYKVTIGGAGIMEEQFTQWCIRNLVVKLAFLPIKVVDVRITKLDREPNFMAQLAPMIKEDMEAVIRARTGLLNL